MKIFTLNAGGTLGMTGKPLRSAKTVDELLEGINIPADVELTLKDFRILQDSTNTCDPERIEMAEIISGVYDEHDAFVILHGTDSLAETTAVLSMIFKRSLQKPIFVIGAQMTKDEVGSDVGVQIANTMRVAKAFHNEGVVGIYNVCINDVWDGTRLQKRAESDVMAFHTPGRYPVAKAWPKILLGEGLRRVDLAIRLDGLRLDASFERQVAAIKVSADTTPWILIGPVEEDILKGVILEAKGSGNVPDCKWDEKNYPYSWVDAIKIATDKGVHVGILSPFEDGRVDLERYELGRKAAEAGAISLESLTPDMADAKFRQAVAKFPGDRERIQEFISTDIVGELLPGITTAS